MTRLLLRSGKDPWDVIGPWRTYKENILGTNLGNSLFSSAVHKTLTTTSVEVVSNRWSLTTELASRVNAEFTAFVVPLANAFRHSFATDLVALTEFIQQLKVPVIVVGVGAQTDIEGNSDRLRPIDGLVREFVRAVLDRSATIGVRGEFTAEYLSRLGFSAVDVIGCPSMYLHGERLDVHRRSAALPRSARVSMSVSLYVEKMGPVVRRHVARYPNLTYLPQDTPTLRKLLRGEREGDENKRSDLPIYLNHRLFREDKAKFFLDPWPWMEYLAGQDFSFGTRLHGSIAAIQAGTPSYLLVHDSRTLELARFHELPHARIADVRQDVDAAQLYDLADFTAARRAHGERFRRYLDFFECNGLAHCYEDSESATAFDERIARVEFPGPVSARSHLVTGGESDSRATRRGRLIRRMQKRPS